MTIHGDLGGKVYLSEQYPDVFPPMPEPNFFIVGAPKAGTTSLYHYLDQHPDIYMSPIKEPCYFSLEARPENFVPRLQAKATKLEKEIRE